jgi:UPF0755 protein
MIPRVLAILVVLFLLAIGGLIALTGSPTAALSMAVNGTIGQPVSPDAKPVHLTVRPGETASNVGEDLATNGIIRSSLAFRVIVRLRGLGSNIEAGDYELKPSNNVSEIASVFAHGQLTGGMLAIPEGWRALEIADSLDHAGVVSRAQFLGEVARPAGDVRQMVSLPEGHSLEGYLYPDSYLFEAHSDPHLVVRRLVANFVAHTSQDLRDGYKSNGLDLYAAVTLASIVEREAVIPAERPMIASVYLNRLRRGMRLQADPTVQYALISGEGIGQASTGYWKRRLTFADLAVQSPYNTYSIVGLPPGPVCSPGGPSLAAVAHPATTEFIYFVARPDGTHAFARTLQEHQKNVDANQATGPAQ